MSRFLDYFHPINRLQRARINYLKKQRVPNNIKALLTAPLPALDSSLYDVDYLCLDFETTGVEPDSDSVLSVGYLPLSGRMLQLDQAQESLLHCPENINAETAVINHIVPQMLEKGLPVHQAMDSLLGALVGKVIIVHGSMIEKRFLNQYIASYYKLPPLPLLWVDTLQIEKSLNMHKSNLACVDLRLASVRQRHGLPEYAAHGALVDALATGELYLALLKRCYAGIDAQVRSMKFA